MSFVVKWTTEAKFTLNENLDYLSKEWDVLTINNFLDRIDEVVSSIEHNPHLYPVYRESDEVHKCVVNKHITLFYRVVNSARIDLITFWNTHQDPKSLKV